MKRKQVTWLLALVAVASCALPELRVDPDLDEENEAGSAGDDDSAIGGAAGRGGDMAGGVGQGGGATGGTAVGLGGSATGGSPMGIGGSATGGKGGAVTGGKGGTTTGGQGGTTTGGAGGVCADLTNCSGSCVDTDTDEGHCGACNAYCEPAQECTNGECICRRLVGSSSYLLIDDLEDDNGIVGDDRDPQLRVGYWYVYNDQSENCTQIPEADPAGVFLPNCGNATCSMRLQTPNGSRGAAHMEGSGCSVFGAGMGFDFANCNMRPTAYDASAYNGIRFWYQSTTPLRFNVSMMAGIPSSMGGTCTDVATECYNHHGVTLAAAPTGMTVTVLFSTLTQDFGTMRAFDKTQLAGLQFSVTQNLSFFVWVDDIYFTF